VVDGLTGRLIEPELQYKSNAVLVADVSIVEILPTEYGLSQNYPNPFNPSTALAYQLPVETEVEITVFDLSGRHVRTLIDAVVASGTHEIFWNGLDDAGQLVPSGIYWVKMRADEFRQSLKMTLIK
jgi:hypothetical protein